MKFYEGENVFRYSWTQMAEIFWFRYPNPFSKHVRTEDVFFRRVEEGILHTKRLLTKSVRVTTFGYNINIKNEPIVEESFIDPKTQTIRTLTYNFGTAVARVNEECLYRRRDDLSTTIERRAWIASSKYYFPGFIESFLIHRFTKSVQKTIKGLDFVLSARFPLSAPLETKPTPFLDKEKMREKARKAKDIATSKAVPIFVTQG